MKKVNFAPLSEKLTWQDRVYGDTDTFRLALVCVGLLFIALITTASVLALIDISAFGTLPF